MIAWRILARVIVNAIKHVKLANIYVFKQCLCRKRLFCKLVLKYQDEILNTTETLKGSKCKK